jgi:N utilization substance protein A
MEIWRRRVIVADEDFENEEITLTEARKIEADFEIEEVSEEVKLIDLKKSYFSFYQNLISKYMNTIIPIFTSNLKI